MCGYLCLQAGVFPLFGGWTARLLSLTFGINVPWPLLSIAGLVVTTALMIRGVGLSIRATWALFLVEFVVTGVLVLNRHRSRRCIRADRRPGRRCPSRQPKPGPGSRSAAGWTPR